MHKIVIVSMMVLAAAGRQSSTMWGGDHIELQVGDTRAAVEFDCARGTIDGPLAPDSNGQFDVAGTFTPERSGPIREDTSQTRAAKYAGTIKNDAMTLRVTIAGSDAPPAMTFELVRGQAGNVRKCR
jgi:hypothetical protein